jgi:hypothetical protein
VSTTAQGASARVDANNRSEDRLYVRDLHETKPFAKTSEFWVWLVTAAAVLAWSMREGGDSFTSDEGMTLVVALSAAYMIARGLAKAGSREPAIDRIPT